MSLTVISYRKVSVVLELEEAPWTWFSPPDNCKGNAESTIVICVFVDLTKAFDTVNRSALWKILRKIGCPSGFVDIIRSFHDGMRDCVIEEGEKSLEFDLLNGTKQGCMLAPMLFSIFFAMMLLVAFKDYNMGDGVRFQTDGDVFDIGRLQA